MSATATEELTLSAVWQTVAGRALGEGLLDWPPDLFGLTELVIGRSEAYRFALSPPAHSQWPPTGDVDWPAAVGRAAKQWSAWVADRSVGLPELLAREWELVQEAAGVPLAHLTEGRDWRTCQALLTLHAIADEACCGLGVALTASDGEGCVYRARGRELLARTGSLARVPPHRLRVLPKIRTPLNGTSLRSLSRYASIHGPGVDAHWHKVHARRSGTDPQAQHATFLLLPWPLRVRESDFRPLAGSVRRTDDPLGFFEFAPSEGLDLELVDRMLIAGRDEVDKVDAVFLPESAIDDREIAPLEALLAHHGVNAVMAGIRQRAEASGGFPSNWVHFGVRVAERWAHIRQNKHHRWSLDEEQINQYHLEGALHPHVRWWEAIDVPRRSLRFVEVGEGIVTVALVCEDLAQIDEVAEVLRSVGPTLVITPLLDGPQLRSRWAARYASVLADDPGSAVLTLTSAGMAQRSRPRDRDASSVIALWKDTARGVREIPLEVGAQGVLLSASVDTTTRQSSDGRRAVENCTHFFDVGVFQVRAAAAGSVAPISGAATGSEPRLDLVDLTIVTSLAEAIAEALDGAPEQLDALLADARPGASWRAELGLSDPSPKLAGAIEAVERSVRWASTASAEVTLDAVITALREDVPDEDDFDSCRQALRSALEQRHVRRAKEPNRPLARDT